MKRFFQQFLTKIIFADLTSMPEDLLSALITLSLNKEIEDDSIPRDKRFKLFQASELNTPEFRCIILELVFRVGLVFTIQSI